MIEPELFPITSQVRNEGCPSILPYSQQARSAQADTCLSNIPFLPSPLSGF